MVPRSAKTVARVVPRQRKKSGLKKTFKGFGVFAFALLTFGIVAGGVYFSQRLSMAASVIPKLETLMESGRMGPTQIYSADGKLLYESVKEIRDPVVISEVPEMVQKVMLAAEDKRFYQHSGVDFWAIARQTATNAREQRIAGGASTLTMQLAKLTFTSSDQTFTRKIDDMALALQIERTLTKDKILELYLNQAYFGSGAYGIAAAADVYFNKKLSQLDLAEAAMLSRCVRRPSDQNPFVNYKVANDNKNVVLEIMLKEGWISNAEYEKAKAEEPKLGKPPLKNSTIRRAPYYVRYVLDELRKLPEFSNVQFEQGGYRIETTLDTRLQEYSDLKARDLVKRFRRNGAKTAAFVLLNKQGEVLAMTGGLDFANRQFNAVTQGRRQPGSSFKPFIYTAGFYYGEFSGPYDTISNATYTGYFGGKQWRVLGNGATMSVRSAIAFSKNAAAVRAIEKVRPSTAVKFCNSVFGFNLEPRDAVLSLVLGSVAVSPLQMAEAYTVFQNYGARRVAPFAIKRVIGPNGQILVVHSEGQNVRELQGMPRAPFEDIDSCMRAVVTEGTASNFASGVRNARGKTGTTNDNRDAWFCGYTNEFIGVGWVSGETKGADGKITYGQMSESVMGGTVTVRLWRDVVTKAQELFGESRISGLGMDSTGYEQQTYDEDRPRGRSSNDESTAATTDDTTSPRVEPDPAESTPQDAPPADTGTQPPAEDVKPKPEDPKKADPPDLPEGSGLPPGPGEPSFQEPVRKNPE